MLGLDYVVAGVGEERRLWNEEFNGERNDIRFKHFVVLAGSVLPVWQKVRHRAVPVIASSHWNPGYLGSTNRPSNGGIVYSLFVFACLWVFNSFFVMM